MFDNSFKAVKRWGKPPQTGHSKILLFQNFEMLESLRVVRHLTTITSRQSAKDHKAGVLEASKEETAEAVLRTTKDAGLWAFE